RVRVERPERVAGDHGVATDREVDDPRAPVGDHDADRETRDQSAGPEAQQDLEQELLHVRQVYLRARRRRVGRLRIRQGQGRVSGPCTIYRLTSAAAGTTTTS